MTKIKCFSRLKEIPLIKSLFKHVSGVDQLQTCNKVNGTACAPSTIFWLPRNVIINVTQM